MNPSPNSDVERLDLGAAALRPNPRILVYGTLIQLVALVLASDAITGEVSDDQRMNVAAWWDFTLISVFPLVAVAVAHAFSEALDLQVREHRRLTWHDRFDIALANVQFLYIAIAPSVLLLLPLAQRWSITDALDLLLACGVLSLFGWGILVARISGLSVLRQLWFGTCYLVLGLGVVALEIFAMH
jgi:hypothetical protein